MQAWTQPISWVSALTILFLVHLTAAAPLTDQTTEIEYYPVADSTGCYYNFQHYDEGDRIITNEPCLNCTCHNRMLMCYLRVCPFTKAIGQDCTVEKRPDQCCPVITCPEVPVQLLTSTTTESSKSTDVGHPDTYGCSIDNLFYSDGARVPSDPNKPCELCYCIRNKTACVMQECTLKIEGCKPVYQEGVCCPVKYDCEYPEGTLLETTVRPTPAMITTTLAPGPVDCVYNNEIYADGALVKKDIPCEHCYCMKGDIVCAVQECGPTPLDKVNCTALPTREGQCCPDTYDCENAIEEVSTQGYEYSTTPVIQPIVSEEEASSAIPSASVTFPPISEQTATTVQEALPTETPAAVTPRKEVDETQTSSELPTHTEEIEEPVAFATTQIPIRETQPKKEDEGYVYPKPPVPGLDISPLPETTPREELNEIATVVPAEVSKQKVPSGEQITEKPLSLEEEKAQQSTSPSPSFEDREKEQPAEVQTTEIPSSETGSTPKGEEEEGSSYTTSSAFEEHTTLVSKSDVAEEEVTKGSAFPTIQPSELPEEGTATTPHELPEHGTAKPITELPEPIEVHTTEQTQTVAEEETTASIIDRGTEQPSYTSQKETVSPQTEIYTQQPSKEPTTSEGPSEITTSAIIEEVTEQKELATDRITEASVTSERTPEESPQTTQQIPVQTQQPTTLEQITEELPKQTAEYPAAAATISGEHVTVEPETVSEYVPSHDHVPVETEEEEEEGSGVHTEEPVAFIEDSESPETTKASVAVTEIEQESTPLPQVTLPSQERESPTTEKEELEPEHVTKGQASTIQEHVAELSTPESVELELETERQTSKPQEELLTTAQPIETETEKQEVQTTNASSELTSAFATESVTVSSATEQPSVDTTVPQEEHVTENLIPGEGSCLVDGQTYSNNSSIPPINQCQVSCRCVSSIVQCESISCSPAPANADNCTPVFETPNTCCPTYSCTSSTSTEIESDSHKMQEVSTSHDELTTVVSPKEQYTTQQPKESTKFITETATETTGQEAVSGEATEKEVTAAITEEATQPHEVLEVTTPSQVSEEIQTTEKPAATETTAQILEQKTESSLSSTEPSRVTASVEENEIPSEEVKEPEIPQEEITTTAPENLVTAKPVTTTLAVETETESKEEKPLESTSSETVTPSLEDKVGSSVQPPLSETEISPTEVSAPATEHPITESEVSQPTSKQTIETQTFAVTSPALESETAGIEVSTEAQPTKPEVTTVVESESATTVQEAVTTSQGISSKQTESEVTVALTEETLVTTTEGRIEHITHPTKEMGKPESHVTESARKPISEETISETVTTEATISSSRVPQEEHIPVIVETPQEETAPSKVSTAATTSSAFEEITPYPGLVAHDIEGGEEEEEISGETEKAVTTEAAKVAVSTEGIKEFSPTETSGEASSATLAPEIPKEITTKVEISPTESPETIEPVNATTLPDSAVTEAEKEAYTEISKEATIPAAASTEPAKEVSSTLPPKEATSSIAITTEALKEVLTTEVPKEITSSEVLSTEGVNEALPTELPKEVTLPEGIVTEASSTERQQEVTSPETALSTEPSKELTSEVISSTEVAEEVRTEPEKDQVSTEAIGEFTTVDSITRRPEEAVEIHTEVHGSFTVTTESEIEPDHVTPAKIETAAPEKGASEEEAIPPVTTEVSEKEIVPVVSEVTAIEPQETTIAGEIVTATTVSAQEKSSSETEKPISEIVPEVTESISVSTSEVPRITIAGESEIGGEALTPTTTVPLTVEEQTVKEVEESQEVTTEPNLTKETVKPQEAEAPQPEATTAKYQEITSSREPEEITTTVPVSEQPIQPETSSSGTELPAVEAETARPILTTEATVESKTTVVEAQTEFVPAQTEVTPALEATTASLLEVEGGKTEVETTKPQESITVPTEVAQEEELAPTAGVSTNRPDEFVTSAVTGEPEEVTSPREQESIRTEPEIETEVGKVEITTPLPERETTAAVGATVASEAKQPSVETESAETRAPESSEKTETEITTTTPTVEAITAISEESSRKPEESSIVPEATTASQTESNVLTTLSSKPEEVTTPKEDFSKVTAESSEEETSQPTKLETTTIAVTSRPEIPGEGLVSQEPTAEKEGVPELESAGATTLSYESSSPQAEGKINITLSDRVPAASTPIPSAEISHPNVFTSSVSTEAPPTSPSSNEVPEIPDYTSSTEEDYPEEEDQGTFGPGTCRYGGKLYMSAQQIPRDDPCDFCFCFRSDIICLQQSCPPPIPHCHEEPIRGFCCPRYECPVSMATTLNLTTTSTTTTTTLPPHFFAHAYNGRATKQGCQIQGQAYQVGEVIKSASGPCLHCTCGGDGQMKCDPKACSPEPMLRQMIAAAASRRRR